MNSLGRKNQAGFTLVELLIVAALLGIVMTAVLGLVQVSQRQAYTTEEVVDVQQNLRVALEWMSRDLRMAGLVVGADEIIQDDPASLLCNDMNGDGDCLDGGESEELVFQTCSAPGLVGRIGGPADIETTASSGTNQPIPLATVEMVRSLMDVDPLDTEVVYVRILRPATRHQPLDRVFTVKGESLTASPPELVLQGFNAATLLKPGDLVFRVIDPDLDGDNDPNTNPPEHPNLSRYRLVDAPSGDGAQYYLARVPTGVDPDDEDSFEIIATKITGVDLAYLREGGTGLEHIRAVRITLTGATDTTQTGMAGYAAPGSGSNVKTRSLTTIVNLRNR